MVGRLPSACIWFRSARALADLEFKAIPADGGLLESVLLDIGAARADWYFKDTGDAGGATPRSSSTLPAGAVLGLHASVQHLLAAVFLRKP